MTSDRLFDDLINKIKNSLERDTTDLEIDENGNAYITLSNSKREKITPPLTTNEIEYLSYLLAYKRNINTTKENFILNTDYENLRININLPPFKKSPTLNIRKHQKRHYDLNDLFYFNFFTQKQGDFLINSVRSKKNIIISGETGSGKTTLLSALLDVVEDGTELKKIIIIEDTQEITTTARFTEHMRIFDLNSGAKIDGTLAIKDAMRQNPDRIIFGEVRDKTAYPLLKGWNTGHSGGLCTIHSNSVDNIKQRLIDLCFENENIPPLESVKALIDDVVDIGVQIEIVNGKRKISQIKNYKTNTYI